MQATNCQTDIVLTNDCLPKGNHCQYCQKGNILSNLSSIKNEVKRWQFPIKLFTCSNEKGISAWEWVHDIVRYRRSIGKSKSRLINYYTYRGQWQDVWSVSSKKPPYEHPIGNYKCRWAAGVAGSWAVHVLSSRLYILWSKRALVLASLQPNLSTMGKLKGYILSFSFLLGAVCLANIEVYDADLFAQKVDPDVYQLDAFPQKSNAWI